MNEFLQVIPKDFVSFFLVTAVSLVIGLSQRSAHHNEGEKRLFGTDRTFTFIGILGYILLIADPVNKYLFMGGGLVIAAFFLVFYIYKIKQFGDFGITSKMIGLLTYCLPLLLVTQPLWLYLLVVVTVLILTELKETLTTFSEKVDKQEYITLAKFLIMAGVVLPMLPNTAFVPYLSITPYKIWLAMVVISAISYISYLLRKFIFKDAGIVLSGILGGLYSSTATTVVLSRKLKNATSGQHKFGAAIIMATGMMYLRVLALLIIFNKAMFQYLGVQVAILIVLCFIVGGVMLWMGKNDKQEEDNISIISDKNPLEFKIAFIFTAIYVAFTFLTYYAISVYGNRGLNVLSFIVGIADIDPFLLNIFQGKYSVPIQILGVASFQAIISNNIAKMGYAIFLAGKKNIKYIGVSFMIVILVNVLLAMLLR